ncbi:protein SON [Boleophthalmus pectinirostris]|uniref:protein SON n=1 Tax=Boleophthalmus pectinirostris TaxID=150288 RepID=UPI00242B8105|nr:protein SON [Boleophthalmus pectinirostris]
MAANIEQIFQDFILNKIKEIEEQKEEHTVPVAENSHTEACRKTSSPEKRPRSPSPQNKKHKKKSKKHKSKKKKKKSKGRDRDSSDSDDSRGKHHRSKEERESKDKDSDRTSSRHRHKSPDEDRRKKRRKRSKEKDSSDSDSDGREAKRDKTNGPSHQPQLPDIIPKQESSSKTNRKQESTHKSSRSRTRSRSRSHSRSQSQSHSSAPKKESDTGDHRKSRTRSRSAEKKPPSAADPPDPAPTSTAEPVGVEVLPSSTEHQPTEEGLTTVEPSAQPASSEKEEEKTEDKTQETPKSEGQSTSQSTTAKLVTEDKPKRTSSSADSPSKHRKKSSRSPQKKKEHKTSRRARGSRSRSTSRSASHRRRSRSRSPRRRRSRSRSRGRRSHRTRSRSTSKDRRKRNPYSQRDRWRREPSHSPVLILRKNRSPAGRKHGSSSPHRISDLDKEQLLEIAKANAAAMCVKAGMPVPSSLRSTAAPLNLPMAMNPAMASMTAASMTAALSNISSLLPSLSSKPSSGSGALSSALEEVKKSVQKQANIISIKEFTEKCKMIVDSKGELPVAAPHVSDEEDEGKPFGAAAVKEQKAIRFSITNMGVRPTVRSDAGIAKEFPVSSGSQHRKKEGEGQGAYGEWVPVEKTNEKAASNPKKSSSTSGKSSAETGSGAEPEPTVEHDSVFPEPPLQPVDISQAVSERIKAQRRLAENPYDVSALCMLSRAQEQVDAWAQSNTVPGLFTGSTGAQVLSSEELSSNGPQAWLKKDQFLKAAPVSGGVGEFLMRKMGWRTGEGLGRNREGTVEPIIIDFKVDRKGLVAEGEKPQKQTGGLVVTKDLMGKHPVSALIELCTKRKIVQPDFVMVHHSGPDHRKNFLFKVTVGGVDYQPQTASPNKKHAKAMAATVALQALGEVPADGPGLYTGPVFTAASTGPLFST